MNTAYLILGGNKGKPIESIEKANLLINSKVGAITKKSNIFVTKAWGNTQQPDFLNQAIAINCELSPTKLLTELLSIEQELGRTRTTEKWEERTIDIDILFFNKEVINLPNLKIPHPYLHERKFVLVPLNELCPEFLHPTLNRTVKDLLTLCKDELDVRLL